MKLAEEHGPEHTVLRVEGSLKVGDTAQALTETTERIARERKGALVLDLSALEYMDSTGVGVLIGALKRFQEGKRDILLAAPQRRILAGLRVTHLDSLFRIYESLDLALAALARESDKEPTGEHKRVP
ncbi:MAG TPA: STAS domain-containing protein [Thermoanaerobaculia bacterium]|jgi:anti-sigma B factor antagonist